MRSFRGSRVPAGLQGRHRRRLPGVVPEGYADRGGSGIDPIGGRYELHEQLGEGTAGDVYRARDLRGGPDVAIKFLKQDAGPIPQADARQSQEADILVRIDDPFVMKIFGAGLHGQRPYLVLELVEGGSDLTGWVDAREEHGGNEALELCRGLVQGVAAIHAAGVIHRDLKPSNILVDDQGRPRVTDLGIAKVRHGSSIRTRTGMVLGTPGFVAPEVFQGKPLTPAADVYALGIILNYALSGTLPYASRDRGEILQEQMRGIPATAFGAVPAVLARLLRQMTALDASQRPDIGDVQETLRGMRWEDDAGSTAPTRVVSTDEVFPGGLRSAAPTAPRRRRWGALAAGLVGACLAVGLLWPSREEAATGPSQVALADAAVAEALAPLGDYSYRGVLTATFGEDGDAGSKRMMRSGGDPWRNDLRPRVLAHVLGRPWYSAVEELPKVATPEWWAATGEPGADRELRARVLERVDALGWLNRLDRRLGGSGDLVPGLEALVEPVVRVRALEEFSGGDDVPGLVRWTRDCRVVTSHAGSDYIDSLVAVGGKYEIPFCDIPDPIPAPGEQLRHDLRRVPEVPAESPFRVFVVSVYDMLPEALLEVTPLDAEGRALARASFFLGELPARFGGQGQDIGDVFGVQHRNSLAFQVAVHRDLLGADATTLRVRYRNLITAYDHGFLGYTTVTGLGELPAPIPAP
jgi:hypothetical protein